ncbi:alpha/beta hydrolase [Burkholderia orbicola]|uniref:alpha/beta hydrolase n=1 Tax=Burkholderia orbicola TaxID=2978683 RepID=UPI003AF75A8C
MISKASHDIVCNEFMIPSDTAGIELYMRNKYQSNIPHFSGKRTLLFVAGSTYPASTSFDLALGGISWMDQLALAGYNTWLVDVRGYGRSTQPPEMAQPAELSRPIVRTPVAVSDVAAAAAFVRERIGGEPINLIGWSWGAALMACYTSTHNDAVKKLVLLAPQWTRDTPSASDTGGELGAYRIVRRSAAKARWLNGVPNEARDTLLPPEWFNTWADATFGTTPDAYIKAPNGTVQDSREFWSAGKSLYDPAQIHVPVLIVHADWDQDCPLDLSRNLFSNLTGVPYRRWVEIGEGTHSALMEKNRWQIFDAVQAFLEEMAPGMC